MDQLLDLVQGEPPVQGAGPDAAAERPESRPPRRGPLRHADAGGAKGLRGDRREVPGQGRGPGRGPRDPGVGQASGDGAGRVLVDVGPFSLAAAEAPAASLQGDLEVFGLPALLQSLAESSASGTLTLREAKGGAVFASVTLREGKLEEIKRGRLRRRRRLLPALREAHARTVRLRQGRAPGAPGRRPRADPSADPRGHAPLRRVPGAGDPRARHVFLVATAQKPTRAPDREGRQLPAGSLGSASSQGGTPLDFEDAVAADSYRIRRLLAHWVEQGALKTRGKTVALRLAPDRQVLVVDDRVSLADGGQSLDFRPREAVGLVVEERAAAGPRARSAPRRAGRSSAGRADRSRRAPARRARRARDCRRTGRGSPSRNAGACARSCRRRDSRRSSGRCSGLLRPRAAARRTRPSSC